MTTKESFVTVKIKKQQSKTIQNYMNFITKILQKIFPKKTKHGEKTNDPSREIKFLTQNNDERVKKEQFEEIYKRANNGEVIAMTDLGVFYLHGIGTPIDIDKGLYWSKKAAEMEDPMGIHNLAWLYLNGEFVKKDTRKAIQLLQKASDQGMERASNDLGVQALNEKNYSKAKEYYELAIKQGSALANENLAFLYLNGLGTDFDIFKAAELFSEAYKKNALTKEGLEAFNWTLLKMYFDGVDYFFGFNKDTNKALSFDNIMRASLYGYTPASKFFILNHYNANVGPLPILEEKRAKSSQIFPQMDYIEKTILNVRTMSMQDKDETYRGIDREEPDELCYGALLTLFGVFKTEYNHINLLTKSSQKGFNTANFWLGYCYEKGLGVEQSNLKAENYYLEIINSNYAESLWGNIFEGSDEGRILLESYYRLALIKYKSENYNSQEIKHILRIGHPNVVVHTPSLMLYINCLINEGRNLDEEELMTIVNYCANLGNDEALLMLANHYNNKQDKEQACDYCLRAVYLGNIDAVRLYLKISA